MLVNEPQHTAIVPQVVTPAQFAQAVGTGINRVREYVRTGRVRAIRHGRRIVIPITEVHRFLNAEDSK